MLLSAALVRLMIRVGTLDHPVERSSHTAPTPKGGGVGIVAASLLTSWLAGFWDGRLALWLAGAAGLAAFSFLDDLRTRGFKLKLGVQTAAALCVLAAGARAAEVALPGLPVAHLGGAGAVLALGWMLFVTNAVNFIDGLNGLASGSVAIACLALAFGGGPILPGLALVAGIAGFLPFNYPRGRIFMGDVGSQFCGVMVAAMAVGGAGSPRVALIVPLALAPILLDAAFTLLRRASAGERITQPHRGHLYQVAQRAGLPAPLVAAMYWLLACWGGICAILASSGATALATSTLATSSLATSSLATPAACLATLMPVIVWGIFVSRKAKQAGIVRW